jgi:hypothetical protein
MDLYNSTKYYRKKSYINKNNQGAHGTKRSTLDDGQAQQEYHDADTDHDMDDNNRAYEISTN